MSTKLERLIWIDAQILCEKYPNSAKVVERFNVERRVAYLDRKFMIEHLGAPINTVEKMMAGTIQIPITAFLRLLPRRWK